MSRLFRRGALVAVLVVAGGLARRRARSAAPTDSPLRATSMLGRNREVAKVGARMGAGYAVHNARRALAGPERRAELDEAFELRTAEEVAAALGSMKGALMKIGQMASFLDDGLPEPMRDALSTLQADAPPMSSELAAQVVQEELGQPPTTLFAEWDERPLAAASIGQVHRAVTHDGHEVAVKVQYPGVDKAIISDLDNSDVLFSILGMVFPGLDPKPIVAEIRERVVEELDYRAEAKQQTQFANWFEGHPFIHIPSVMSSYSSGRVLTTDLAHGARFAEVAETWSQEERDLAGESIYRFVFRSLYRFRAFNGDPHPGNYLFRPGGQVTFLDFGLVKHFTAADIDLFEAMIRAIVLHDDAAEYRAIIEDAGLLRRNAPLSDEQVVDYFAHFYELVRTEGRQPVTHEYAAETVRRMFDATGKGSEVPKYANVPPSFVVLQRINLGLYAILARLGATHDWLALSRELWPQTNDAPKSELGMQEAAWLASRYA
ncbi:MAG TPA: AarF/ABC1/UbiB kinase family protein [Acidimicrobiales bacterium]|nr:AarF/ABC1/UbiB kinase family protein [Acidimicrobiales bacterium]